MDHSFKEQMRERARELGFLDARVAPAELPPERSLTYKAWLDSGFHGEMGYMERFKEDRGAGLNHVLPGTKSVIALACSYYWPDEKSVETQAEGTVRVARYALGKDYHYVLRERLATLVEWLEGERPGESWRICVDSAPVPERSYAVAAGLGFIGKNGMLISWMGGSYTFLAEILTTAELEPDQPGTGTCGNCTRCLDACPTQAFAAPGVVDSRRCISYLTIEKRSELSPVETAMTGEWAFGCDICQEVCPYNKSPITGSIPALQQGVVVNAFEPAETFLAPETNSQFEKRFAQSPILRAGKKRIQQNVQSKLGATSFPLEAGDK